MVAQFVQNAVVGEYKMGVPRNVQSFFKRDAVAAELVHFRQKRGRVDDRSSSDIAFCPGVEDPGGDQVEAVLDAVCNHRVAGIIAALIADNDIAFFSKDINDLPLAFIAPMRTNDDVVHN